VRQAVADAIVGHARERALARDVRDVQVRIADGDPTEVIAELLADGSHDLLVMGSRGHGTLRGLLTGSVSHKAIGLHACPVLVVP
jgi:nucleotide-binding universal stress UspA family protein